MRPGGVLPLANRASCSALERQVQMIATPTSSALARTRNSRHSGWRSGCRSLMSRLAIRLPVVGSEVAANDGLAEDEVDLLVRLGLTLLQLRHVLVDVIHLLFELVE